ncbi:MAG TPA: FKBP-type peptidyl-prolyl cis-trans isomerase [Acidimicrobiales bacterium]|nr:FKBP-type peptidyl-prolyl cis-trans isomerase [Acidimicrobiales bacterium]
MRVPTKTLFLVAALTLGPALVAGCGSSSPSSSERPAVITWSPAGTFGTKPTVLVPASGLPPTALQIHDLIVGTGAIAAPGHQVTVQYVGYSWTTKKQFDASWDRNQTFPFTLGVHQVIQGWDEGVAGMKVGGRRELIIPPALAYGASSPGAGIAPNDTLIFVVDLVSVG